MWVCAFIALAAISAPGEAIVEHAIIELDATSFEHSARRVLPLAPATSSTSDDDPYRRIPHAVGLEMPWRCSATVDPALEPHVPDPAFDDSEWELLPTDLSFWPGERAFGEAAWFRLRLHVAPELIGTPLGLLFTHTGDLDAWFDGAPVVAAHAIGGAAEFDPAPKIVVLNGPDHVLAVRLRAKGLDELRARGLVAGVFVTLIDPAQTPELTSPIRDRLNSVQSFFVGAALALALLHLCMFVLLRERRENLFFALEVLSVAGIITCAFGSGHVKTLPELTLRLSGFQISIVLTAIFGTTAAYAIFLPAIPKRIWLFAGVGLLVAISTFFTRILASQVFAMVLLIEQLRVIGRAFVEKKEGSRIIGLGSVLFLTAALLQMLGGLGVINLFEPLIYMYGFACLLIAMSFYLARRFANISRLQQVLEQLRATQAQLIQSEKMAALGMLVAGVAHEINTPVGAISSVHDSLKRAIEKLRGELSSTHPKELRVMDDAAKVIESGSSRVTEIVRRLKSFARLDEAAMKKVDLHEGIEDTLVLLNHQLKQGLTVVKIFGVLPPIACYPSQLNQVFLNLLVNARQAITDCGEITITTGLEGSRAFVEIKDTGVGIPPENLARIFDPGFTTKGVGVGTGLGLSICYQIVQQHKGEIRVKSEVGKGTAFTVLIPTDLDLSKSQAAI